MTNNNEGLLLGDNSKIKEHDVKLYTMVFLIFTFLCGGAFGIEEMIGEAGPGLTLVLLILLPFVWALPQALTASELGSAIPYTGGFYKWNQVALGEFWGFTAGWCRSLAQYAEMPVYIVLTVTYIGNLVPLTPVTAYLLKALVIIFFTFLNLRGIKEVGWVSMFLSIIILVAFAFVAVVGIANWQTNPFDPMYNPEEGFMWSLSAALAIGMWMYSGYASVSTLAGDVKDKSIVYKGLLIGLPLIMVMYVMPTMAGIASTGEEGWAAWGTGDVNYGSVAGLAGAGFTTAFIFVAIIGNASNFNTCMLSLSRGFYAICEDNLGPKIMIKVSEKRGVPTVSIISVAIVALIGCTFDFSTIVTVTVTLLMVDYVLIWISLIVLRVKHPEMKRPFKLPFNTAGCVAMVSPGILICIIALMVNGADYFFGGMIGLAFIPVLYVIFKRMHGGLTKLHPERYPVNPKTKLAYGDLNRFTMLFAVFTLLSLVASFFMPFYEGEWGPEYYMETYGPEGTYMFIITGIKWITGIYAVITAVLFALARKFDNKDMRPDSKIAS